MRRNVLVVLLSVLVALALVFGLGGRDAGTSAAAFDGPAVAELEQRIAAGDVEGVRAALPGARLDAAARAYVESVLSLTDGRPEDALAAARRARAAVPDAWRPLSIEYAALMALGREGEAGALVRERAQAAPHDERVLALAAHHLATATDDPDPRGALELLDRIDALPSRVAPPGDPTAVDPTQLRIARAVALLASGRTAEAYACAAELALRAPGDPRLVVLVAECARRAGRDAEALDAFRAAVHLAPQMTTWRKQFAQLLLADPDCAEEALAVTGELLAQEPHDRAARVLRARALARSERSVPNGPDHAAEIYRELLAEDPNDVEVLRNLAVLLYDWKQGGREGTYLDDAYELLARYRRLGGEIDARLRDTWDALVARRRERLQPGALDALAEAAADAHDVDAVTDYHDALVAAGRATEAGALVRRALAAAPDEPALHVLATQHFLAEGPDHAPETALEHVQQAIAAVGGGGALPEPLLWLRCRCLLAAERGEAARADALALLARRPGAAPYLLAAGRAAALTGRTAEAESHLRDALLVEPSVEGAIALAALLVEAGDRAADALVVSDAGLRLAPTERVLWRLRAVALTALPGRRDEGLAALRALAGPEGADLDSLGALALALLAGESAAERDEGASALARYRLEGGRMTGPFEEAWTRLGR